MCISSTYASPTPRKLTRKTLGSRSLCPGPGRSQGVGGGRGIPGRVPAQGLSLLGDPAAATRRSPAQRGSARALMQGEPHEAKVRHGL